MKEKDFLKIVLQFILDTSPNDREIDIEEVLKRIRVIYSTTINSANKNS